MNNLTRSIAILLSTGLIVACGSGTKRRNFDGAFNPWTGVNPDLPDLHYNVTNISPEHLKEIESANGKNIILVDKNGLKYTHKINNISGDIINNNVHTLHETSNLTYTLYGLVDFHANNPLDIKWEGFVMGVRTKENDMPKTGNATYTGRAFGYLNKTKSDVGYGDVSMNVDFGKATLNGEIKGSKNAFASGVHMNGVIKGSQFTGEAFLLNGQDNAQLFGQFNGPNAEELTGVYDSNMTEGMTGSFGASKNP